MGIYNGLGVISDPRVYKDPNLQHKNFPNYLHQGFPQPWTEGGGLWHSPNLGWPYILHSQKRHSLLFYLFFYYFGEKESGWTIFQVFCWEIWSRVQEVWRVALHHAVLLWGKPCVHFLTQDWHFKSDSLSGSAHWKGTDSYCENKMKDKSPRRKWCQELLTNWQKHTLVSRNFSCLYADIIRVHVFQGVLKNDSLMHICVYMYQ